MSDEGTVAEVIDSRAFSDFCGVDSSNQIPSGDTLGRFRNLLIQHGLQEQLFAQVVTMLMERGLILKKGTIVDSTIISAPSSTKNMCYPCCSGQRYGRSIFSAGYGNGLQRGILQSVSSLVLHC